MAQTKKNQRPKTKNYLQTQAKASLLARLSAWFSHLGIMEKIGVVLLVLSGVGLLMKLLEGGLKTPEGKAKAPLLSDGLPKGCEDFFLKEGSVSPLDPAVRLLILGESHYVDNTGACLDALLSHRSGAHKVLVEQIPRNQKIPCSHARRPIRDLPERTCEGWDALERCEHEVKLLKSVAKVRAATDLVTNSVLRAWLFEIQKQTSLQEVKLRIQKLQEMLAPAMGSSVNLLVACSKFNPFPSCGDPALYFEQNCTTLETIREFSLLVNQMHSIEKAEQIFVWEAKSAMELFEGERLGPKFLAMTQLRNRDLAISIDQVHETPSLALTFLVAGAGHVSPSDELAGTEEPVVAAIDRSAGKTAVLLSRTLMDSKSIYGVKKTPAYPRLKF
jgi:hypothetical protein